MIYLVGGPPRSGKTTLAKALAQELSIPFVSADYLMSVIRPYIPKDEIEERLPRWHARWKTERNNDRLYSEYTAEEILQMYLREASTFWPGIENFILSALSDDQSFIIEGTQLRPDLVSDLVTQNSADAFRVAFLYKSGEAIADELKLGQEPNDWATRDTSEETYPKIAAMLHLFGEYVEMECSKRSLPSFNMSGRLQEKVSNLVRDLAMK